MRIHSKHSGFDHPRASEITPRAIYEQRRDLIKLLAGGAAGTVLAGWAARDAMAQTPRPGKLAALPGASWLAHFDLTGVLCLTHFAGAFWRALTSAPHSAALPGTLCPSPLPGGCVIAPQCLKTAAK